MATLILEDGRERTVTPANAKQGFTLAELYSALGCNVVEVVRLRDGQLLVIDENGKLVGREVNDAATTLARPLLQAHDVIVGPALLCSRPEFK
jgi:hypothetical protein